MKRSKIVNIIIAALTALFMIISTNLYISYKTNKVAHAYQQKATQQLVVNNVATWQSKVDKLKIKFNQDASINVLVGETDVSVTFTDRDVSDKGNSLGFLQKKFAEWKSKSLNVASTYKFGYSFPLHELKITNLDNGNLLITISRNALDLKYVEEVTENTVLTADYSIFAKEFSPQQISAISARTKIHVRNTLQNNKELRDESVESLKKTVETLAKGIGFKNIEFEVKDDFLLDNSDAKLSNITY